MFRMHILLVEDNLMNQKLMLRILTKFGYTCDLAVNGKIATEIYHPDRFQLILMDIQMPIMDGITAAKKILSSFPHAMILALTANITDENRKQCLSAGMKEFITKPIAKAELDELLKTYETLT